MFFQTGYYGVFPYTQNAENAGCTAFFCKKRKTVFYGLSGIPVPYFLTVELTNQFPPKTNKPGEVALEVENLTAQYSLLNNVSFITLLGSISIPNSLNISTVSSYIFFSFTIRPPTIGYRPSHRLSMTFRFRGSMFQCSIGLQG